jgi:molybdate transport system ATP-binding protein
MNIVKAENNLFRTIARIFSPGFKLEESWMITGQWREAQEKVIRLIRNETALPPFALSQTGIPHFSFPFKTAFVSYQENIADKHATYYQQRFYATEVDDIKTLKKYLFGENTDFRAVHRNYSLLDTFRLRHLLNEEVIKLSNGETRKATILKALLSDPQVLILDNIYAGIDHHSVTELNNLLTQLAADGLNLILLSNTELPAMVSHVLWINSPDEVEVFSPPEYKAQVGKLKTYQNLVSNLEIPPVTRFNTGNIVKLNNVSVSYGEKHLLRGIDWCIKPGEKWALKGDNGAGKSTLLSLIYADHPQSYANDIELFDKKRGTGESIWDIKEKMSLYSPELYYYFEKTLTCREALLSGIYSHPFKKGTKNEVLEAFAQKLFLLFFHENQLDIPLNRLSGVQQQLVLFLRTLARNAPLVLLDEPFQAFDIELTEKCKQITEVCCRDKTLIFVSHNTEDLPGSINRIFRLDSGKGTIEKEG